MVDSILLVYRLRFLLVGALIAVLFVMLSFAISSLDVSKVQAKSDYSDMADSPNVVTNGMVRAGSGLEETFNSFAVVVHSGAQSVASATTAGGKAAARGVGQGLAATARATGSGVKFVGSIPGNVLGAVSNSADGVRSVLRPAEDAEVPIIDPDSPELKAALAALPPAQKADNPAPPRADQGPIWPMRGRVTAEFGVPHWPYQATHTGIDISDGQPAGVTPVKPFRPGRVIDTVHTRRGLGNHVIVDHGSGVTSVYAHLDSITVNIGQEVTIDTTLGLQGTTGVSTGPHLHLEIRVHGKAANPRQFIPGNP